MQTEKEKEKFSPAAFFVHLAKLSVFVQKTKTFPLFFFLLQTFVYSKFSLTLFFCFMPKRFSLFFCFMQQNENKKRFQFPHFFLSWKNNMVFGKKKKMGSSTLNRGKQSCNNKTKNTFWSNTKSLSSLFWRLLFYFFSSNYWCCDNLLFLLKKNKHV